MNIVIITIVMMSSLLLLLLTGRQIFLIIGGVGIICALVFWGRGGVNMPFFAAYSYMRWYVLLALPPFVFMGLTLARSGVADKLFDTLFLWLGPFRGGLAMADVGFSCLVAAMSGTNAASLTTSATISLPQMLRRKYDKKLVVGTVLAGGGLGFLIPPSVVLILYAIIAKVSVGHLWLAAIIPGLLLASMYVGYIFIRCRTHPSDGPAIPLEQRVGWVEKFRSLKNGLPAVILIFVVLGLLFMGVTTLIECAAIGAAGSLVCAAINRRLKWKMVLNILDQTMQVTVMVMWIFAAALLFSAIFDGLGAVHGVEKMLFMAGDNKWVVMIIMQLSFILMGTVLDDTAMLLIVAPLYIPIVANLDFSLVWWGILYVLNCQIAYLTPPFGYSLFMMRGFIPVVAPDAGISMGDIYRSVIPFVLIQAACIGIIMVFPQIALWLPSLVFGG
ncbi:TRAP transporter large permease subunit [Chloroflexota bacterium]